MIQDYTANNQYMQAGYAKYHGKQYNQTFDYCCEQYPYAEWNNDPDDDWILDGESFRYLTPTKLTHLATYTFSVVRVVINECTGAVVDSGADPSDPNDTGAVGFQLTDRPTDCNPAAVYWHMKHGNNVILSVRDAQVGRISKDLPEYAAETHSAQTYFPGNNATGEYVTFRNLRWRGTGDWATPAVTCLNYGSDFAHYHNSCSQTKPLGGTYMVDADSEFDVWDDR